MRPYLLRDISKNDEEPRHVYRFEIWSFGHFQGSDEFTDINKARRYYINHDSDLSSYAIKLFIDGERVDFTHVLDALEFTVTERALFGLLQ